MRMIFAGFAALALTSAAQAQDDAEASILAELGEPYVTTRSEGTGLGLPIVKKIIEEHGGSLTLETAPAFDGQDHHGAMAVISLPLAIDATTDQGDKADE